MKLITRGQWLERAVIALTPTLLGKVLSFRHADYLVDLRVLVQTVVTWAMLVNKVT
jgi:hypothetical protein